MSKKNMAAELEKRLPKKEPDFCGELNFLTQSVAETNVSNEE